MWCVHDPHFSALRLNSYDFPGIPALEEAYTQLQPLLERLPSHNHSTLDTILEHVAKVRSYEPQNKMSIQNLAVVFGPTLIRPRHEDIKWVCVCVCMGVCVWVCVGVCMCVYVCVCVCL